MGGSARKRGRGWGVYILLPLYFFLQWRIAYSVRYDELILVTRFRVKSRTSSCSESKRGIYFISIIHSCVYCLSVGGKINIQVCALETVHAEIYGTNNTGCPGEQVALQALLCREYILSLQTLHAAVDGTTPVREPF